MEKGSQIAVVEMSGKNVGVTIFENKPSATAHALAVAQECTEKTVGEVADSLRLRGAFSEGEYRIVVTPVRPAPESASS